MKVIIHVSSDPDCPEPLRYTAHLLPDGSQAVPASLGKAQRRSFLPVCFFGATAQDAAEKASSGWNEHIARERARKPNRPPGKAMRPPVSAATKPGKDGRDG